MNSIHIIGGGLAGLSLGIALRGHDVPVTVTEAAAYPRHRVCGEFISGAGQSALKTLGLEDVLQGAVSNIRSAWFSGNQFLFSRDLPAPALGLSRFELDQRLASRFKKCGGTLVTRTRAGTPATDPGLVWACGRRGSSHQWVALKLHCRGLETETDLAMHLGTNGYVGLSRIEDQQINVCGLFRTQRKISPGKSGMLIAYLRTNGLNDLADQLTEAEIEPESISATTALNFVDNPWPADAVCIGDSNSAIPPFTGNGMSMAMESARHALPELLLYADGSRSWPATRTALRRNLRRHFRTRLAVARFLHPFLLNPASQKTLARMASSGLVPFNLFYRLSR